VDAARAARKGLRIARNCDDMIDRIGSRGNAFWESLCEEARFVSCHDLGDRDVEIYRIDNDGAQAFHFYERVIGDTNAVAIGKNNDAGLLAKRRNS